MWFYDQQMRQYQDPKMTARQKAEFHAQQRIRRIESMKWFGLSNSRPAGGSDPVNGDYSPALDLKRELFPIPLEWRRSDVFAVLAVGAGSPASRK